MYRLVIAAVIVFAQALGMVALPVLAFTAVQHDGSYLIAQGGYPPSQPSVVPYDAPQYSPQNYPYSSGQGGYPGAGPGMPGGVPAYQMPGYPSQQGLYPGPVYGVPGQGSYPGSGYGVPGQGNYATPPYGDGPRQPYLRGQVVEAPAGLVIPITLLTAISTQVAKPGDYIEARVSQDMAVGGGMIAGGSVVVGQVTDAEAGRRFNRSGELGITFSELRTPGGGIIPISGHLIGDIGKYAIGAGNTNAGTVRGEGMGTKVGSLALRSAFGAGAGAALGTAMGAITGGRLGTGAWAGTAIGGGGALVEGLIMRKGRDVIVPGGTMMQFQLDQPAVISQGSAYPI